MKRRWPFVIFILLLVTALAVHIDWTWKRKLSPRGGRYFFHRVELAVPSFRQSDEKWSNDPLGGVEGNGTLGGEGCAVAAAAMVFKFYGIEIDPQKLNWFLTSAAWREFSFPSPVDVHGHRSDKQNKNENDERQQALQNAKLYTRLPARESFRSISRKF